MFFIITHCKITQENLKQKFPLPPVLAVPTNKKTATYLGGAIRIFRAPPILTHVSSANSANVNFRSAQLIKKFRYICRSWAETSGPDDKMGHLSHQTIN